MIKFYPTTRFEWICAITALAFMITAYADSIKPEPVYHRPEPVCQRIDPTLALYTKLIQDMRVIPK